MESTRISKYKTNMGMAINQDENFSISYQVNEDLEAAYKIPIIKFNT